MIGSMILRSWFSVVVVALLVTACGSSDSTQAVTTTAAPALVASETIIRPAPAGEDPVKWKSVTVEDGGRTVVVSFNGGNPYCFPGSRLVITPRNGVAVTEFFTAKPEPGQACTMEAVGREERVTLAQPLPPGTGFVRADAESKVLMASETVLISDPVQEKPEEWRSAVLGADGRTITFNFLGGAAACFPVSRVLVTPQGAEAGVGLFTSRIGLDVTCTDMALDRTETVTLERPLPVGTRIVPIAG